MPLPFSYFLYCLACEEDEDQWLLVSPDDAAIKIGGAANNIGSSGGGPPSPN